MLNLIRGICIDFISSPLQLNLPKPIQFGEEEVACIDREIQTLINKGAVIPVTPKTSQFVSNIFT